MTLNPHGTKRSVAKRMFAVGGLLALAVGAVSAEDAAGDWGGLLAGQYHIVVHVTKEGAGHYKAALESPDQGNVVLPADDVVTDADDLSFTIPKISATYTGHWDAGKKGWVGTWTQGVIMSLSLTRMTGQTSDAAPPKRPKETAIPAGPHSPRHHEVIFDNASADLRLAVPLAVPNVPGRFPSGLRIGG